MFAFPPLQAATAWGFSGVVLLSGMLGVTQLDSLIGRRPSVLISYAISIVGIVLLWLIQYYPNYWLLTAFVLTFGSMIGSRGPLISAAPHNFLPGQAGRHHLWHDLDRQRARLSAGLMERRPAPRLLPQLQSVDHLLADQRRPRNAAVFGGAGVAALAHDPEKWAPVFRQDHAQNKN